ncbi:PPOX class F420-dependent oxidoreductase [Nakamurella endophytica]|uniref:Pyridoxamine 5'-phosphate oxidase N-terminal domain-containing protein n=1 Tax=Nakamurella endophytica TaxID=1748367 RepID=A0A917TEU3_9ACTN|nr:PPOX class F420-dependent oxidoreductase [Nakamurella endophytica]GGM18103.1 hypothetical protein GCM10011594_42720 [Nakamurella endophytica]
MQTPLDLLGRTPYVELTTFRRDGTPVPTPVWLVRDGDELLVWTNPQAGKVKRLRRDPRALLAPCTRRGRPLGRPVAATGRVLPGAETSGRVMPGLYRKYGWTARMTQLPNRIAALLGRPEREPGGLALVLEPSSGAAGERPAAGPDPRD